MKAKIKEKSGKNHEQKILWMLGLWLRIAKKLGIEKVRIPRKKRSVRSYEELEGWKRDNKAIYNPLPSLPIHWEKIIMAKANTVHRNLDLDQSLRPKACALISSRSNGEANLGLFACKNPKKLMAISQWFKN